MICPVDGVTLVRAEAELGLPTHHCPTCAGDWLRFGDYLTWRERQTADAPETSADAEGEMIAPALGGVRRCPDCAFLLSRYHVGHDVAFSLDRCGNCNGVWLDASEWAALRDRGLHDNVHQMFGPGWQFNARSEERRRRADAQFERQLGPDYQKAKELAAWVAEHPRRSEIMAFIQSRVR